MAVYVDGELAATHRNGPTAVANARKKKGAPLSVVGSCIDSQLQVWIRELVGSEWETRPTEPLATLCASEHTAASPDPRSGLGQWYCHLVEQC